MRAIFRIDELTGWMRAILSKYRALCALFFGIDGLTGWMRAIFFGIDGLSRRWLRVEINPARTFLCVKFLPGMVLVMDRPPGAGC